MIAVTEEGDTCQDWGKDTVNRNSGNDPADHPEAGLIKNYCRNPSKAEKPWCYTLNPLKKWGYCAIPVCSEIVSADVFAADMPIMHVFPSQAQYYVYIKDQMTWLEARKACQKLGGDLATFPSYKTFDDVVAALKLSNYLETNSGVWVGANRRQTGGKPEDFKWISGEFLPVDFNKWHIGYVGDKEDKGAFISYENYQKFILLSNPLAFPHQSLCQIFLNN